MTLVLFIGIAWLAVVGLVIALCLAAARADAALVCSRSQRRGSWFLPGIAWREIPGLTLEGEPVVRRHEHERTVELAGRR